jgi:hypothetical protein
MSLEIRMPDPAIPQSFELSCTSLPFIIMLELGKSSHGRGKISRVISVCERKDIEAWRISSRAVVRHIEADSYFLLCPDQQLDEFKSESGDGWTIQRESSFIRNCDLDVIRMSVTGANIGREHWIFQQFLKINAIIMSDLRDDDVVLIWDADTIPLNNLVFTRTCDSTLMCYGGSEVHSPYFSTIENLFGFGKQSDPSFIAQCMPVRVGWIRSMIAEIEDRFETPYEQAILSLLPGVSGSEFSEYETIGNWTMARYPNELEFRKNGRWLRNGRFFTGGDLRSSRAILSMRILCIFYDYMAVENWRSNRFSIERFSHRMKHLFST